MNFTPQIPAWEFRGSFIHPKAGEVISLVLTTEHTGIPE